MGRPKSCLIIGAGICGLTAARFLTESGMRATVLEKSRGVGGRMATRRSDEGVFDHGAQAITVRSEVFGTFVSDWLQQGLLLPWSEGFADSGGTSSRREMQYRGAPGMTSVPKYLTSGLRLHCNQRASTAEVIDGAWRVTTDQGGVFSADALLLTPPVPQSLALLGQESGVILSADLATLRQLEYDSALAILYALSGETAIPPPGGLHLRGDIVSWIADNRQKGISPGATTVTLHTTPGFSETRLDVPPEEILREVTPAVAHLLRSPVTGVHVHRWRYATPKHIHTTPFMLASRDPVLLFAGDAFGGADIEGATLSGLAAARKLLSLSQ
jgi:renalase